jgi:phage FluMu gp28-like protein
MGKSFDRSKFQIQEAFLREMKKSSPRFRRLCIDQHGIGVNLAENLRTELRSRVEGLALVGQVMESHTVGLKIAFEQEAVSIPRDRELTGQIRSIKKMQTEAGYARFNLQYSPPKAWIRRRQFCLEGSE